MQATKKYSETGLYEDRQKMKMREVAQLSLTLNSFAQRSKRKEKPLGFYSLSMLSLIEFRVCESWAKLSLPQNQNQN